MVDNEVAGDKVTRSDYLLKLIRELQNVWRSHKPEEKSETEQDPAPAIVKRVFFLSEMQ